MIFLGTAQSKVNPQNWYGWSGNLAGTIPDILLSAETLKPKLRKTYILKDEETTVEGYIQLFSEVSKIVEPGELIVWWDSGHGCDGLQTSQLEDNFQADQGITAYNGIISDTQIAKLIGMFKQGKLVYACDRCHSGSMYREIKKTSAKALPKPIQAQLTAYDYQQRDFLFPQDTTLKIPLKYFGACQVNQTADDLGYNGRFTYEFWSCYKKNRNLPYISLYNKMLSKFPSNQTPKYVNASSDKIFNTEKAFNI